MVVYKRFQLKLFDSENFCVFERKMVTYEMWSRMGVRLSLKPKKCSALFPILSSGRFPFVRTGRPDHGQTSQLADEIGFFQGFFLKNYLPRAYFLGLDWSGWMVLNSHFNKRGTAWPVSSDKWKAPSVSLSLGTVGIQGNIHSPPAWWKIFSKSISRERSREVN